MPFPEQTPRAFNKTNIEAIRPGQMGVYGLFRSKQWVYVGSGDIRERLLRHLGADNPCISKAQPTHWVDEVTAEYVEREKQLIAECKPSCNKKIG